MNYDRLINYFNFEPQVIDINLFIINALIGVLLSFLLEITYRQCANSMSNRSQFSYNFMLLTLTTMLIITLVGSSIALSLGLVGALSIVRYRAAIKEPEELSYLFVAIAIGLGLGANQPSVTIVSFLLIIGLIWVRYFIKPRNKSRSYNLLIRIEKPQEDSMKNAIDLINKHFKSTTVKRFDEDEQMLELAFKVKVKNITNLNNCKQELLKFSGNPSISFVDSE